jgi:hypothetical protein
MSFLPIQDAGFIATHEFRHNVDLFKLTDWDPKKYRFEHAYFSGASSFSSRSLELDSDAKEDNIIVRIQTGESASQHNYVLVEICCFPGYGSETS